MQKESEEFLLKIYKNFHDRLEIKERLKYSSVLLSSLKVKSNVRFMALTESAIPSFKIPSDILNELTDNGLIRNANDVSSFAITAKGIWQVEERLNIVDKSRLIDFIDEENFALFKEGKQALTEKEKIIILTLLSARAFSQDSALDLMKDDNAKDAWKSVIEKSYEKLTDMELIKKKKKEDLFGSRGADISVINLFQHTDDIPKKTKGVFRAAGKRQYYLDVHDGELNVEKLSYLFWQVFGDYWSRFGDNIDPDQINSIFEYCRGIANDISIYVFDLTKHKFSRSDYDDPIRSALIKSVTDRSKWE